MFWYCLRYVYMKKKNVSVTLKIFFSEHPLQFDCCNVKMFVLYPSAVFNVCAAKNIGILHLTGFFPG